MSRNDPAYLHLSDNELRAHIAELERDYRRAAEALAAEGPAPDDAYISPLASDLARFDVELSDARAELDLRVNRS